MDDYSGAEVYFLATVAPVTFKELLDFKITGNYLYRHISRSFKHPTFEIEINGEYLYLNGKKVIIRTLDGDGEMIENGRIMTGLKFDGNKTIGILMIRTLAWNLPLIDKFKEWKEKMDNLIPIPDQGVSLDRINVNNQGALIVTRRGTPDDLPDLTVPSGPSIWKRIKDRIARWWDNETEKIYDFNRTVSEINSPEPAGGNDEWGTDEPAITIEKSIFQTIKDWWNKSMKEVKTDPHYIPTVINIPVINNASELDPDVYSDLLLNKISKNEAARLSGISTAKINSIMKETTKDQSYYRTCLVCQKEIKDGFVQCPECDGSFHYPHLAEWLHVKGTCPNCRRKITVDPPQAVDEISTLGKTVMK